MASEVNSDWFVVLTEPQQEITTVWRLHELGLELYTPIVRERRPTRQRNKHGQKICVVRPRPMFPGYSFLRTTEFPGLDELGRVRGVRDLMWTGEGFSRRPVTLPHEAVMAVFAKQHQVHQEYMQSIGGRVSHFKRGDMVRVDEGSVYSGLVAPVDKIDGKGRIEILLGMIRHTLPADMVVAA